MNLQTEKLDFETFKQQVVEDYRNAFHLKLITEKNHWHSFYRRELFLSVLSKQFTGDDLVLNLPVSPSGIAPYLPGQNNLEHRDFLSVLSFVSGMFFALHQIKSDNNGSIFTGLSVAGMSEIDFLKLMEKIASEQIPVSYILLDVHKAKGDFLKVRDYFEPKVGDTLKTYAVNVVDYRSVFQTVSEGIVAMRTTGIPVVFYPFEPLISQVDFFNEETDPVRKIRAWMLANNIITESELNDLEVKLTEDVNPK